MTEPEEFDALVRRADLLGLFLQEHRMFDPCRGGGPYYIAEKRKFREQHCETLLKYATAEHCWDFLERYAREHP